MTASDTKGDIKASASVSSESFMDKWLVVPKLLYFVLQFYVYLPHSVQTFIMLDDWGMKASMTAVISSMVFVNFFGTMLWSYLADKTGRYKTVIGGSSIAYTVFLVLFQLPGFERGTNFRFYYLLFVFAGFNFFLASAFPLVDALILGILTSKPNVSKSQFGNQRLFGTLGHFLATVISFVFMRSYNSTPLPAEIKDMAEGAAKVAAVKAFETTAKAAAKAAYAATLNAVEYKGFISSLVSSYEYCDKGFLITTLACSLIFIASVFAFVPDVKPVKGGHHGASHKDNGKNVEAPKNPILTLIMSPTFMFFMLFVLFSGIIRSVTGTFQKPLIRSFFDGDFAKMTSIEFVRTVSEVFVYATSKHIVPVLGVYWVLALSQITGIIRFLGYGLVTKQSPYAYWKVVGCELLKGFSSGLISTSAIPIAGDLAPAGCESSAQGLYSGNYVGISAFVGNYISSFITEAFEKRDPEYVPPTVENGKKIPAPNHEVVELRAIQKMFVTVSVATIAITLVQMAKFIFVDRVMGIPGFPRRRSFA